MATTARWREGILTRAIFRFHPRLSRRCRSLADPLRPACDEHRTSRAPPAPPRGRRLPGAVTRRGRGRPVRADQRPGDRDPDQGPGRSRRRSSVAGGRQGAGAAGVHAPRYGLHAGRSRTPPGFRAGHHGRRVRSGARPSRSIFTPATPSRRPAVPSSEALRAAASISSPSPAAVATRSRPRGSSGPTAPTRWRSRRA